MTSGEPFRLRVAQALSACIKEVTPNNGYGFDLSDFDPGDGATMERVFRGRPWFGDNDPLPMVSILEALDETDFLYVPGVDDTTGSYEWPLLVQGFVADDPVHPTDPAYRMMRDVRRRLLREKRRTKPGRHSPDPLGTSTWQIPGCRVTEMKVSAGKVRPADDVSAKAYWFLIVTLTLTEDGEQA